jgi:ADP-ribosylglycohydrolase
VNEFRERKKRETIVAVDGLVRTIVRSPEKMNTDVGCKFTDHFSVFFTTEAYVEGSRQPVRTAISEVTDQTNSPCANVKAAAAAA